MTGTQVNHTYTAAELIQLYIGVRARKEAIASRAKEAISKLDADLTLLERELDIILTDRISRKEKPSIPTPFGTAFHQEQTKYVLEDREGLLNFFVPNPEEVLPEDQEEFTRDEVQQILLEERGEVRKLLTFFTNAVAKKEVEQFMADEKEAMIADGKKAEDVEKVKVSRLLPVGIKQSAFTKVSVRAAS